MACFTPEQYRLMTEGLLDAFPDRTALANMLVAVAKTPKVQQHPTSQIARKLRNINRLSAQLADMSATVYDVLQAVEASDLCSELVKTAFEWAPYDANLARVHRQLLGIATVEPSQRAELERLLSIEREHFLDPLEFAARFAPIRYRVCRIEWGAKLKPLATGFLVAADVVMTNHHVIEPVLTGQVSPDHLAFGFDRVEVDGLDTAGPTVGLLRPGEQAAWLLASGEAQGLDYALLRLDAAVGELPILAGVRDARAARRGWLALSEAGSLGLESGAPLLIFQHPDGMALRLDMRAVGALSAQQVTYTTNTMPGSSGSPCFDRELRLSALHRGALGELNRGIPVAAILADLAAKGLGGLVAVE